VSPKSHHAERRYAECNAECRKDAHYAERHSEYCCAELRKEAILLSVVMLHVVMLRVVAADICLSR
jgi:hypothetical protein